MRTSRDKFCSHTRWLCVAVAFTTGFSVGIATSCARARWWSAVVRSAVLLVTDAHAEVTLDLPVPSHDARVAS